MVDPLDDYCSSLICGYGYGYSPAYPLGDGGVEDNGSSYGSYGGRLSGLGSMLPTGSAPEDPSPGKQYFGGGGSRSWRFADGDVREILESGDDVTRTHGLRRYRAMALVHPVVASNLTTIVDGIMADPITLKVAVEPPKDEDADGARELVRDAELAARLMAEDQESIDRLKPSLDFVLRQLLWSMFVEADAGAEVVPESVGGSGSASYRLKSLVPLQRSAWAFVVDGFRNVIGYAGPSPSGKPVFRSASSLMVLSWQPRAGDPRGTFLLRAAHPYVDFAWRMMDPYFQFLDHFGSPLIVGTASKDAPSNGRKRTVYDPPNPTNPNTVTAVEELQWALAAVRGNGYLALPNGSTVTVHPPSGDGSVHIKAQDWCDTQIARVILGDERASQATEYGARASAEVGERVAGKRVQEGRKLICDRLGAVLRWQNEMNHGAEIAARLTPYVMIRPPDAKEEPGHWAPVGYQVTEAQQAEIDARLSLTPRVVGTEEPLKDLATEAEIYGKWIDAGAPEEFAAAKAGLTEDEQKELIAAIAKKKEQEAEMLGDGGEGDEETEGDESDLASLDLTSEEQERVDAGGGEAAEADDEEEEENPGLFSSWVAAFAKSKSRKRKKEGAGRHGGSRRPFDPGKHPKGEGGKFKDVPGAGDDAPKKSLMDPNSAAERLVDRALRVRGRGGKPDRTAILTEHEITSQFDSGGSSDSSRHGRIAGAVRRMVADGRLDVGATHFGGDWRAQFKLPGLPTVGGADFGDLRSFDLAKVKHRPEQLGRLIDEWRGLK